VGCLPTRLGTNVAEGSSGTDSSHILKCHLAFLPFLAPRSTHAQSETFAIADVIEPGLGADPDENTATVLRT